MKRFIYYQLIDKENFCNYKAEQNIIFDSLNNKEKLVIYGPRNFGKTSLIKNVVLEKFLKEHKKAFVFFIDLLEVRNLEDIHDRIQKSFSHAFSNTFPVKDFTQSVKTFIKGLNPQINFDPETGAPSVSLSLEARQQKETTEHIFYSLQKISKKIPTILIIDEFQDIANIDGAQAFFRTTLESLNQIAIILMGSKQHLLSDILANPKAPLAFWGKDLYLKPIPYEEYTKYINERFKQRGLSIDNETSMYLQNKMNRVPESINILCDQLFSGYTNQTIKNTDVDQGLRALVDNSAPRYEAFLSKFTKNEETIFILTGKKGFLLEPTGKDFVAQIKITPRAISKIIDKAIDLGILSKSNKGLYLTDAIFCEFLKQYK